MYSASEIFVNTVGLLYVYFHKYHKRSDLDVDEFRDIAPVNFLSFSVF